MQLGTRWGALAAAALLAIALGCGRNDGTAQNDAADRDVVQRIRQALVADNALSPSAKNVMIDAKNDAVTLRGSVATEQERAMVAAKAKQVAGNRNVDNELVVASR